MCHPAIAIGIGAAVIGSIANVSQAESDVAYQNAVANKNTKSLRPKPKGLI